MKSSPTLLSCSFRSLGFLTVILVTCVSSIASAQSRAPAAPNMTLDDGKLLVKLARGGMVEFIKSRTSCGKYPIAAEMKHLTKKFYPASVTLRSSGKLLSRRFRADGNVCRSVLAAALDAMRSRDLPDRVTPSVLNAMTIEIEVHGPAVAVSTRELGSCIVPGLTGVKVSRGKSVGYVLPSTLYRLGLSARGACGSCLAQLPASNAGVTVAEAWSIFRTKHYVGYPDGAVVQLFRGKILVPPQGLTEEALSSAVLSAGLFLAGNQDASGQYRIANRKPSLHEHLHATYAMVKLSNRHKKKIFSVSVNRALSHAVKFVLVDKKQARVLRKSSGGQVAESPTRATAWLLLTLTELPPDNSNRKLAEKLARALQQDVVSLVSPSHGLATPQQLMDWSVALLALRRFLPKTASTTKLLAPLQKTMQDWAKSGQRLRPLVFRGCGGMTTLANWRQIDDSDLPDRRGGFISSGIEPSTLATATAAICLSEAIESATVSHNDRTSINRQILRARRFCYQMLYRNREAYWCDKPVKMLGAARVSPVSSSVGLNPCAAVIEALLIR
jgi:hypothetical protein